MISKHFIERVSKGSAIFYRLFFSEGGVEDFIGEHMVLWRGRGVGGGGWRGDQPSPTEYQEVTIEN